MAIPKRFRHTIKKRTLTNNYKKQFSDYESFRLYFKLLEEDVVNLLYDDNLICKWWHYKFYTDKWRKKILEKKKKLT